MMRLTLELLGVPQLQRDNIPVTTSRRAVVALLAYLAVSHVNHPHQRHTRESVSSLFWPNYDQSKALSHLRHTLWEVTKFIGDDWILTEHETIFINPKADLVLDVREFRSLFTRASEQTDPMLRLPLLLAASGLYRDSFLSGFSLKAASNFNEWISNEGENLRRDLAVILNLLIEDYCSLDNAKSAIPYAQRLIALDPIDEAAHGRLMQLYAFTGQHGAALQQYQMLEKFLRRELNVDPQPETRELYKKIRKGDASAVSLEKNGVQLKKTTRRHNLPVHLTKFVGRKKEHDDICRLIKQNRLLTLVGTGGIGKTRLSLEAGQSMLHDFRNGVWFIPLDSVSDKELVPKMVASFFGIIESSDHTMAEALVNGLRSENMLLIFDNCEHLLDACIQLVESLLKNCPKITVLATSRDVLGIEGEVFYHVPSLAIPLGHKTKSMDEFTKNEAVRLFAERASLIVPGFELTNVNLEAAVNICNHLDGIPLAIELAAARLDIFSMDEILEQLNRSFDLLVSHKRSVRPRHQTMRASIDWSWQLLSESEQTFVRQLSVFAGGWTLNAAEAICDGDSVELISGLVKKSWIEVYQEREHKTRYFFHAIIRKYAHERFRQEGEEERIRDCHLEYFLKASQHLDGNSGGDDKASWLKNLFAERDNIGAALKWAALTNVKAGLYMSTNLRTFWENYELREEARWILLI